MNADKIWVDAIRHEGGGIDYLVRSHAAVSRAQLPNKINGDRLRVYVGTYARISTMTRAPQVMIANCTPVPTAVTKEKFDAPIFVGPREEAFALFDAHVAMME